MKIAFIHPYDYFESIPTLVALAHGMRERGHSTVLFYCGEPHASGATVWDQTVRLPRQTGRGLRARWLELRRWRLIVSDECRASRVSALICVDPYGVTIGAPFAREAGVPFSYLSLEMLFWRELRSVSTFVLKAMESWHLRFASRVLIQDATRLEALRASCRISRLNGLELPNAWPGPCVSAKSPRLRNILGLTDRNRIVIHAGSVAEWTMVAELAEAAHSWPNDYVFVVQSRFPLGCSAYESKLLAAVDGQRVHLLQAACPAAELTELLSGADVGIAFYAISRGHPTLGTNLELAGKSSGKLSSYLQAGLPVIANGAGSLAAIINRWKCGRVVREPADVAEVLGAIASEEPRVSTAARECFGEEFAAARYLHKVIDAIESDAIPLPSA